MAGAAAAALLAASACSDDPEDGDTGDGSLQQVTYITGFGTFGREAPAYVAIDQGYFEEEGIEVTIQPGQGTTVNITQVVEGAAEFALADLTGTTLAFGGEDVPRGYTVIGAVQQQTVTAIMALEESGISSPRDLEGTHIGDGQGSFVGLLFPLYAELVDIDEESINYDTSFPPQNLPTLLSEGAVDAIGQFVVGQPSVEAAAGGRGISVLPFSDVLRDLYGNSMVTSEELVQQDPELVRGFVRALSRGIEFSAENPEQAGQIFAEFVPEADPEVATAELELMAPYVIPPDPGAPIGSVDEQRVARAIAILESGGLIPAGITPQDIVSFDMTVNAEDE